MSESSETNETKPTGPKNTINITGGKSEIKNLVAGTQLNADSAEGLAAAAKAVEALTAQGSENTINIGPGAKVRADNVVAGVQINLTAVSDMAPHVEALAKDVDDAVAAGELHGDAAEDAQKAITRVKEEIKKPKPASERVLGSLKRLSEILEQAKTSAESLTGVGKFVLKAAPYAVSLFAAAKAFFG